MTDKKITGIFKRYYTGTFSRRDEKALLDSDEVNHLMQEQWEHPEEMKVQVEAPDFDAIFNRIEQKAYKNTRLRRFPAYRLAAGIALLAGLAMALYFFSRTNNKVEKLQFATVSGEIKSFTLPDGSKLWLGENSRVSFPANFTQDRIIDLKGLAFFKVLKNNTPFVVNAGELTIKVTGTSFSVSNYADVPDIEAILVEGVVNITDRKGRLSKQMAPNEKITFNRASGVYESLKVNARELTLWKESKLTFNNSPLSTIAVELGNRYGMNFRVEKNASAYNFTFTLGAETLDEALTLIGSMAPIEATEINDTIVLSLLK